MPPSRRRVLLVAHTRWDREGAEPHHRLRIRLAERLAATLDELGRDGGPAPFLLDGQAVLVEDHLAVRPEDEGRIRALAASGALALGPWYVLPEPSLVSGEALVRNLRIGRQVAEGRGGCLGVGYLAGGSRFPDQLPQVLMRAGLGVLLCPGGGGAEGASGHWWEGPDGSRVFVAPLAEDVPALHEDGPALLSRGGEYRFPEGGDLPALREAFPDLAFEWARLPDDLRALAGEDPGHHVAAGELAIGRVPTGVLSTRVTLKQANEALETLLSLLLEPVLAAARFLSARPFPAGALREAWKLLLLNQARPAISGTGTDAVHRETETRFACVAQAAEELLRLELKALAGDRSLVPGGPLHPVVTAVNPLPRRRDAVVERLVVLPPLDVAFDEWGLFDEGGRPVPFEISEVHYVEPFRRLDLREPITFARQRERFRLYREHFPARMHQSVHRKDRTDCCFTLRFLAEDLPGVGHSQYFLRPLEEVPDGPPSPGGVLVAGDTIGNDLLTAHLHPDGTFDLFDKRTGEEYLGLNLLLDTEDVGDEFDTAAAEESATITSRGVNGDVSIGVPGGLAGSLTAEFVLRLPESVEPDRRRRSPKLVPCPVRVTLSLDRLSRALDVELAIVNRAEDHRLRAVFPTGIRTRTLWVDGPYHVARRSVPGDGPPARHGQREFCFAEGNGRGLALFTRGLPEVAAAPDADGGLSLELSLLRAVGWLSRDDLAERRMTTAGPMIPTPGAQCRGVHRFRYAVAPFAGDGIAAGIPALARAWRVPVLTRQGIAESAVPGGRGLLSHSEPRVRIEAIERVEDRDTLTVRLVNLTPEPVEDVLELGRAIEAAWETDLRGVRGEPLAVRDRHSLPVALGPHEIATREVAFEGEE